MDSLKPGDAVTIDFPVQESTTSYTVNSRTNDEQTYTCKFRGSTVVDISPRDNLATSYPLFLRKDMRRDETPMKKVSRFIPDRMITKW